MTAIPMRDAARHARGKWALLLTLAGAWLVLLLPATIYSQWFTLDVGGIFARAAIFPHNLGWALLPDSPYNIGGRYFPAYWLYNFGLFRAFSSNIPAHFAVQNALFVVALAITCGLFYTLARSFRATCVFGVLACLGGAVAENAYTLGKAEPLAYLLVIGILWTLRSVDPRNRRDCAVRLAAIAVMTSMALWMKETSLALLAFCPFALATRLFTAPREPLATLARSAQAARYAAIFIALLLGALISRIPGLATWESSREAASKITYLEYKVDAELVADNVIFYVTQQPDVLFFGLAALAILATIATGVRSGRVPASQIPPADLEFAMALLLMAWSYYLVLMVWRWPMGYYMLLPSLAFKFCALYGLVAAQRARLLRKPYHRLACLGVALGAVYGAIQYYYVATSQVTFSRMYTEAISRFVALSRPTNRLIMESYPFYSEQVNNTRQAIFMMSGESRIVSGIADLVNPAVNTPKLLKLLDISQKQLDNNERALPEEDDFLLVLTGNKLATWFVRGVTPYYEEDSILRRNDAYDMIPVAEGKTFVPTAFVDLWTNRPFFGRTYFGYKLYRIAGQGPRLIWRERYPDGWIGRKASIRLFPDFARAAKVTVSTPEFNTPNRVVVRQDDAVIQDLQLAAGTERSFVVENTARAAPTMLTFQVERTVVPKALKLNKDGREIGVLVNVQALP